jgi:ATP-binding cassette subfamily C (CFTR/MRP) protein 4
MILKAWNFLTYSWVSPSLQAARTTPHTTLSEPAFYQRPQELQAKLAKAYAENPSDLFKAACKVLFPITVPFALAYCGTAACYLSICWLIGDFVSLMQDASSEAWQAYSYASGIAVLALTAAVLHHVYFYKMHVTGGRFRYALISLAFDKLLKLQYSPTLASDLLSIVAADLHFCDLVLLFASFIWITPLYLLACGTLLFLRVGFAGLMGLFVLTLAIPLQILFSRSFTRLNKLQLETAEKRTADLSGAVAQIRGVKLQCMEGEVQVSSRQELQLSHKAEELGYLRRYGVIRSYNMILFFCAQGIVSWVTFSCYVALGHSLTAEVLFTTLGLLSNAQYFVMIALPNCVEFLAEVKVSMGRLQEFLAKPEVETEGEAGSASLSSSDDEADRYQVVVDHLQFRRASQIELMAASRRQSLVNSAGLHEVSLGQSILNMSPDVKKDGEFQASLCCKFPRDALTLLLGKNASGKSTLLRCILGETRKTRGVLSVKGSVAYYDQTPTVVSGSVKDNILFGNPLTLDKYQEVVQACCLDADFATLAQGDDTVLGEQSAAISGGQKARICLARTLYRDCDIYLLDDPFSALDASVAEEVFSRTMELLRGKTVILACNNFRWAHYSAHLVVLRRGFVAYEGSPEALDLNEPQEKTSGLDDSTTSAISLIASDSVGGEAEAVVREEQGPMQVPWKCYWDFAKLGLLGSYGVVVVLLLYLSAQGLYIGVSITLASWANEDQGDSSAMYWRLAVLVLGLVLTASLRTHFIYQSILTAACRLHALMVMSLLRAPVSFFDQNPLGRILNRFSRDLASINSMFPYVLADFLQVSVLLFSLLLTISVTLPMLLVPFMLFTAVGYCYIRRAMKVTASLHRLESSCFSKVQSAIASAAVSLVTVRALKAVDSFTLSFQEATEAAFKTYCWYVSTSRWLQLRLDVLAALFIACTAFSAASSRGLIDQSYLGVALVYCIQMVSYVVWMTRQWVETQNSINCVHRCFEFASLPTEAAGSGQLQVTQGGIEFKEVAMRYQPGLPYVLSSASFTVLPREKVGIVGRTGCGKSSVFACLLKLCEISQGFVKIDGSDISTASILSLRSQITVITQSPFIVQGSLRSNLDLHNKHSEEAIWGVLDRLNLKRTVQMRGLDVEISAFKFSESQAQLINIARAFLSNARLVLMDEVTASIDIVSEDWVLGVIYSVFKDCTVLSIAHKPKAIQYCARVLRIESGYVVES